jgi:ribosomal-protein-alanine N-acetyltransferase
LRWQDGSEVIPQLTTRRLEGRPLAESDLDDLYLLHRDLAVLTALGVDTPLSAEETREFLERKLAHWHEHGFGIWMFRDPAGAFVGRCGIHRWSLDEQPEVEIGYVVRSRAWGQGFAPEMGAAVVDHAFSELGLRDLVGFIRPTNTRSRRVLEKLDFVYERTFTADGEESVLYRRLPSATRAPSEPSASATTGTTSSRNNPLPRSSLTA